MRILILGGDGMLGHQLLRSWQKQHDVFVSLRRGLLDYAAYGLFHDKNSIDHVDVLDVDAVRKAIDLVRPDALINAVGIIKQRDAAHQAEPSIAVNALLPHQLYRLCIERGIRLVHLSTDCVFSGKQGYYTEADLEDARDLYGRSKLLGEVDAPGAITLRTSIIGLELARKQSLIEWFLAQRGVVRGFTKAIYSGFTTQEMARVIDVVLREHSDLSGVYHVASAPINKYELLHMLARLLHRDDIEITADDSFVCDRSLDGSRFCQRTGYYPPSWLAMLSELAQQFQQGKDNDTSR
jgi:dTDP-4-dehydrorhamnose reductase